MFVLHFPVGWKIKLPEYTQGPVSLNNRTVFILTSLLWSPPLPLCSNESYVIGFVVPNQRHLLALADQYGVRGSWEELCNSKAMEELVLEVITETALEGEKRSKRRRNFLSELHMLVSSCTCDSALSYELMLCLFFCRSPARAL